MRKVLHLVILTWNFAEKNFFSFIFQRFCQTSRAHIQNTFEPQFLSSWHVPAHVPLHTNISTTCEICSKLTIKTSERCHWRRAGVFIGNTVQISLIVLKFWLLNLIKKFSDGNVNKTKTNYVTSVYLSLRMILNCKKKSDPFPFPRSRVFFVHQEIFEKTASVVSLGPLTWFSSCFFGRAKKFSRYEAWSSSLLWTLFLRFLVSFISEFSSKLDGVILPGSVDDAALPVLTKKNRDRINNFKNLQKVLFMSVIIVVSLQKRFAKSKC